MNNPEATAKAIDSTAEPTILLSYLTPEEKHGLVGSFVIEDFWDTFNLENAGSISKFRDMAKESIPAFIDAYQDVWDYVITVNQLDDRYVAESTLQNQRFNGLSVRELQIAGNLLSLSLYSELEKDCLMALNKTVLIELAEDLRAKYNFDDEEYQLLLTPSFETFFTKYHFDHFEYAVTEEPDAKAKLRDTLIRNFHANDPALFELRYSEMHFQTGEGLSAVFTAQKAMLANRAAKKTAFIDGREDLIAFEKLLEYDNFLDFEYRYNLEACPEYYVRRQLFDAAKEAGLFPDAQKPLHLTDVEFIEGVNELIALRKTQYITELSVKEEALELHGVETFAEMSASSLKQQLENGSVCRAVLENSQILIVGYDTDQFIARDTTGNYRQITIADIETLEHVELLRKYAPKTFDSMLESIQTLNQRTPYLDRSGYEPGIRRTDTLKG
jgi:hypothetical protein